ncbi:MAG: hypothetical protein KDA81_15410 [Planctomycetaceae bacterium]|nr:hypothetical protein [Planctomycetaceae bacterium]
MNRFHVFPAFVGLLLVSLSGCGGPGGPPAPEMFPVSGTVNLDGQPLAEGSITIDPVGGKGVPAMGGIKDGKFSFQAAAGEYIARFSAIEVTSEKDEYGEPITRSLIGDEFNGSSTTKASITSGENNLSFDVKGIAAK